MMKLLVKMGINPRWKKIVLLSILIGALSRGVDVTIGYGLGAGRPLIFIVAFIGSLILCFAGELIWFKIMSDVKKRD